MNRKLLIAIFVTIALMLAIYPFNALSASQSTPQADAVFECGDLPTTIADVTLTDALPTAGLAIDQDKAVELASKQAIVSSRLPAPNMRVQFLLYSNDTVGRSKTYNDDEADKNLLYQDVPVWVVSFCGLKMYPIGGKGTADAKSVLAQVRQELSVVIDARTGEVFHQFSFR